MTLQADTRDNELMAEKEQLKQRLEKLQDFFKTPEFHSLDRDTKKLLREQAEVMGRYLDILLVRIRRVFSQL